VIIQAGQLRDQITLYSVTKTVDAVGGVIHTLQGEGTYRCMVKWATGKETVETNTMVTNQNAEVTIRQHSSVDVDWFAIIDGQRYNVAAVTSPTRSGWTVLQLERWTSQNGNNYVISGSYLSASGSSSINFTVNADATKGKGASGSASFAITSSGAAETGTAAFGTSSMSVSGTASADITLGAAGSAAISFGSSGDATIEAAYSYDSDALAYFTAAEAAGGSFDQTAISGTYTEEYVKTAISDFVAGLKTDGLWAKIELLPLFVGSSFAGLSVPLKGSTMTLNNFVTGDYVAAGAVLG
jgi:SPP1 family predicted phage head-tail adaptor